MRFQNHSKPGIHPSLLFSPSNNIPIPPIICQRKEILEDSDDGKEIRTWLLMIDQKMERLLEENKEMVEVNLKRILKKIRPSGKIR